MKIGEIRKIGIALAAFEPHIGFFAEQLSSIKAQTFTSWICVVSFDSPMDETLNKPALNSIIQDKRFVFVENKTRLGHKKNFERALKEVLQHDVDAIAFSDQDDVWYPRKLEICAKVLSQSPPMSLVHSDMHVLNENGTLSKTAWEIEKRGVDNAKVWHLLTRNVVAGCSVLMDADLALRFSKISENVDFHDHWYALVASSFGRVVPIFEPLYSYRQHQNNVVAVSPFRGRFTLPLGSNITGIMNKAAKGFLSGQKLALSLTKEGIKLPYRCRFLYVYPFDLGLGLGLMGLLHFFSDPPLSRACLARAIGKIRSLRPI